MATVFVEGFDKYGTAGLTFPALDLSVGKWTVTNASPAIAAGLSGQGYCIGLTATQSGSGIYGPNYVSRTLPANKSRIIGGFRFNSDVLGLNGITFVDGSTPQCSIYINRTSGFITVNTGAIATTSSGNAGTALATSSASVASGSNHYLEYDITFGSGAAGGYTVWLDGVQILSGSGTTIVTANSYCNVVQFNSYSNNLSTNTPSFYVDDVYVFDNTTTINNGVLLSNPYIITQWPFADQSVQFTPEYVAFGYETINTGSYDLISGNTLYLIKATAPVNCTVNAVYTKVSNLNGSPELIPCIYADSSGAPGALLATGSGVTVSTAAAATELLLSAGLAVTAGTNYWIGFLIGGSYGEFSVKDSTNLGYTAGATYASGAPATAPAMTSGQNTLMAYVTATAPAHNFASLLPNPPMGTESYVEAATVGNQDTYQFPSVPVNIEGVYTVVVSANTGLLATGAHTVDLVTQSGTATGFGSITNQPLTTSFVWYDSPFDTDPNTTLAWTVPAVSIAYHGMKLAS